MGLVVGVARRRLQLVGRGVGRLIDGGMEARKVAQVCRGVLLRLGRHGVGLMGHGQGGPLSVGHLVRGSGGATQMDPAL